MKTKNVLSVVVTTNELAAQLALKSDSDSTSWNLFEPIARALFTGSMDGIRKAFREGYTTMLLPDEIFKVLEPYLDGKNDEELTDSIELRIVYKGRTIGVLIDREFNY